MNFGTVMSQRRRERGLRISELAEDTGIDIGTISRIENEKTQVTLGTAVRFCEGLDISLSELLFHWQGRVFPDFEQRVVVKKPVVLTVHDVKMFVEYWRHDEQKTCLWLADLLNTVITSRGKVPRVFVSEDIEKLLLENSLYRFEVQYPPDMTAEDILYIYHYSGVLTIQDVGVYLRQIRQRRQILLEQLEQSVQFSMSVLSRLETGMLERIKLRDIVLLDETLEQDGKVVAMYWDVYRFTEMLSHHQGPLHPDRTTPSWTRREAMVVTIFITICRWLQLNFRDDSSWINDIHVHFSHLNLLERTCKAGEKNP